MTHPLLTSVHCPFNLLRWFKDGVCCVSTERGMIVDKKFSGFQRVGNKVQCKNAVVVCTSSKNTSTLCPALLKNAGDCEKRPDSIT